MGIMTFQLKAVCHALTGIDLIIHDEHAQASTTWYVSLQGGYGFHPCSLIRVNKAKRDPLNLSCFPGKFNSCNATTAMERKLFLALLARRTHDNGSEEIK